MTNSLRSNLGSAICSQPIQPSDLINEVDSASLQIK